MVEKKELRVRVEIGLLEQFKELNERMRMWKNLQDFMVWASKKMVVDLQLQMKKKGVGPIASW